MTDLTNTKWLFNSSVSSNDSWSVNFTFNSPQIVGVFNYIGRNLHWGDAFPDLVLKDSANQDTTYSVFYTSSALTSLSPVVDSAGWYLRGIGETSATFTKLTNPPIIEITGGSDVTSSTLIELLQTNATQIIPKSSFNSFKLNNNVLTFNGVDYTLNGTATITDTNLSSFKGISCTDNGDNTITLNVNGNVIVVDKYEV